MKKIIIILVLLIGSLPLERAFAQDDCTATDSCGNDKDGSPKEKAPDTGGPDDSSINAAKPEIAPKPSVPAHRK